jgi:hypothetical protein
MENPKGRVEIFLKKIERWNILNWYFLKILDNFFLKKK